MEQSPRKEEGWLTSFRGEMNDLFKRFFGEGELGSRLPEVFRAGRFPLVDISESDTDMTYRFELPGLEEKDIDVELRGSQLIVSGERRWEEKKEEQEYHRVESQYGTFRRSVTLPEGLRLDPEDVTASYKQGILRVAVPKVEPTPASKIEVKSS